MNNIISNKGASLLFVLLLFIMALVSCTDTKVPDIPITSPIESESTTLPKEEASLELLSNGVSSFKILWPLDSTAEQKELIFYFRDQFEKRTGVRLEMVYEKKNDDPKNDNFEILIGNTDRTESLEISRSLRKMDHLYCVSGNKLVFAGGCENSLKSAVQYFFRKFLDSAVSTDKSNVVFTSADDCIEKVNYRLEDFRINGTEAYKYKIVYSESDLIAARNFAFRLSTLISNLYGYDIDVVKDSAPISEHEIIIGNTNRSHPTFSAGECSMTCKDGKLYFYSPLSSAYTFFYSYVENDLFKNAKQLLLDSSSTLSAPMTALLSGGSENILNRSGDVRILFNNVWSGNTESAPAKHRALQLAELYSEYAPDIIGLQEFSGVIKTELSKHLTEMGYKEVPYTTKNQNYAVRTPIYYDPKAVELVNSGYWAFNDTANDKSKSIGWGIFKDKNGKLFCAASTHFYWTSDELGEFARQIVATELCEQMSALSAKYGGIPIIIGGDYNCKMGSAPLGIMKSKGFTDIESTAQKTELNGTHHSYPTINSAGVCTGYAYASGTNENAIDHIFSYSDTNLTVNLYDVIEDLMALASSDHCPLLTDITLK